MKQTVKTSRAAGQLEKMFRALNTRFFDGKLPEPIITLKKTPGAYGHITCGKTWTAGTEQRHEINISTATLDRPIEETTATLLHEMCHLYNMHDFSRVGFTNAAGEAPYLICREQRANGVIALTYYGTGFPLSLWIDNQLQIESALNLLIASVHDGDDRRTILLECVLPNRAFDIIRWDNSLTHIADDNLLVLGRGLTGDIVIDLNRTPHILIGGNTGSGKTVLLRCLLWQAIHQGDIVYIADFKGGVDFGSVWHTLTDIITEEDALLALRAHLIDELEERKKLLVAAEAANITEYGAKTGGHLPRIILCVDEAAEVLDKANASKERKEFVSQVADRLSTLTRQGRAMGIHVWIGVQRGDADVLPGQIKNNLNIRVCGRADATLSTITIGDGRAAEQIPSDAQGRFITADGEVFQAYYFDDSMI